MGTHAMIGFYNKETGSVDASYCHYDGYLEGVGRTLVNSYNSVYDAEIVAKGGYLSSLEDDYLTSRSGAVHKDSSVHYESVEQFMENGYNHYGAEYLYLFDGEIWFYVDGEILFYAENYGRTTFKEVENNLKKM